MSHPDVGDAAVIGVPDPDWGELVVAVVEPGEGVAPSEALAAALVEHCRAGLAHFKCPRRVDFTDRLPRTDSGKLVKRRLRDEYRAAAAEDANVTAFTDEVSRSKFFLTTGQLRGARA